MRKKETKKNQRYNQGLILILVLAALFRFYHFSHRWGLGGDGARDALIARECLARRNLPLVGSFASAGPFVFGPMFYWLVIVGYLIFPFTIAGPWILAGIVGVATVLILVLAGRLVGGDRLSILVGLLAATSPQLVVRSLMLGQHSLIAATTALLMVGFLLFWQKKKLVYALLVGLSLGLALSMHYQAVNLLIFFPAIFLVRGLGWRKKVLALGLALVGFLLPSLPLIIWDSRQGWANTRNILDYFLIGQYRLYVPNSWRLFVFDYFPDYWSFVAGGFQKIAFILIVLVGFGFVFLVFKKKVKAELLVLGGIFFIWAVVNRYYQGERSEGYLVYFAPLIILFSAWMINALLKTAETGFGLVAKLLGTAVLLVVLGGNLVKLRPLLKHNNQVKERQEVLGELITAYPEAKFTLYDYQFKNFNPASALSVLLSGWRRNVPDGWPIGLICAGQPREDFPFLVSMGECDLVDLREVEGLKDERTPWGEVSQAAMYEGLVGWSQRNKLESPFSLRKFTQEKWRAIFS